MELNKNQKAKLDKVCACGKKLTSEEAEFWGECPDCRIELPIKTCQRADYAAWVDRNYNGDMFGSAEW